MTDDFPAEHLELVHRAAVAPAAAAPEPEKAQGDGYLSLAQRLFARFDETFKTDPDRARTQLIAGIQIAIRDGK